MSGHDDHGHGHGHGHSHGMKDDHAQYRLGGAAHGHSHDQSDKEDKTGLGELFSLYKFAKSSLYYVSIVISPFRFG